MCACESMNQGSAGHFHGVADLPDALGAVRMRARAVAGTVHGAGAGQRGRSRASETGHTGGRHWQRERETERDQ